MTQITTYLQLYCIASRNKAWKRESSCMFSLTAERKNWRGECKSYLNLIDKQSAAISVFIHNPYKIIQKFVFRLYLSE